jgi:hypothetical protein
MEKRFAHRKAGKVLAAATAAAGLAAISASQADASLIIDLRATGVSSDGQVSSSKNVTAPAIGDVVTIGVFAQVSGTNGVNDETISIVGGSFTSGAGGLLGNLSNVVISPFTQSGYTNGSQTDFDSDGDLDVGSTGTTATSKMAGRANPAASGTPLNGDTSEIQIATLTFTVTGGSGSAVVNFIPRSNSTGANWNEDGVATFKNPTTSTFGTTAGVTVVAPEPASIGLLGIAGLGLLARRRDKKA